MLAEIRMIVCIVTAHSDGTSLWSYLEVQITVPDPNFSPSKELLTHFFWNVLFLTKQHTQIAICKQNFLW